MSEQKTKPTIHDYDKVVVSVYDNRELDQAIQGILGFEVVDVDELYLTLEYDEKSFNVYCGWGQFRELVRKALLAKPQFVIPFFSSVEDVGGEE